jgi:transcriptional regulator with XRE-family HTH domain
MDQEKIGNLIKEIRKNNNLTQKDFAEKLGVTPQAVSKWENGKNIPDISVLKEIKKISNIDLDSILDGENNKKRNNKLYILIALLLITLITIILVLLFFTKEKNDFEFKQIGTTCNNFNITGSAAYNKKKTAIYISNIEYCGEVDSEIYSSIECNLYESHNDTETKIESCGLKNNITLEDFLKNVDISVQHVSNTCLMFRDSNMYLLINATSKTDKITTYRIPIELKDECLN